MNIKTRKYSIYSPIEADLALDKTKNYLFDLSYLSLLEVNGDKAVEFLQGQLTCDLRQLSDIQMVQGAQCNLKGRILALLDVIDWTGVKLVMPQDLLAATELSLSKTALLSRVSLSANTKVSFFGFYLQNNEDILLNGISFYPRDLHHQASSSDYCFYHLDEGFYVLALLNRHAEDIKAPFLEQNQYLGSATWHALRLAQKQIEIYPESRGLFLPHRLDLHQTPYLSFDKGCYKGQEIIARTHYRATLKHELKLFHIHSEAAIYPGQKLLHPTTSTEVGELVDFAPYGSGNYLIAVSMLKEPILAAIFEGDDKTVTLQTSNVSS